MENQETKIEKAYLNDEQIAELRSDFRSLSGEEGAYNLFDKFMTFIEQNQTRDEELDLYLNFYKSAVDLREFLKADPNHEKSIVCAFSGFSFAFSVVVLLFQTKVLTEEDVVRSPWAGRSGPLPTA